MKLNDCGVVSVIVNQYTYTDYQTRDYFSLPRPFHTIGLMMDGRGILHADGKSIPLAVGDVFLIAQESRYGSEWLPDRESGRVSFFAMHFCFDQTDDFLRKKQYPVQKIDCGDFSPFVQKYRELQKKLISETEVSFETLALFFGILSDVMPGAVYTVNDCLNTKIQPALDFLSKNYTADTPTDDLADLCLMSRTRFFATFKKMTGLSPVAYRNRIKLNAAAKYLLAYPAKAVEEVAYDFGYATSIYFIRQFKKQFGITPYQYRKNSPVDSL